jgi:hypothetical protein
MNKGFPKSSLVRTLSMQGDSMEKVERWMVEPVEKQSAQHFIYASA